MPLTKSFRVTVQERIKEDPLFGEILFKEAIAALLAGEFDVGKSVLRDYINGTIGFIELGRRTKISPKSLMRMFSEKGNPQTNTFFKIVAKLQEAAGIELRLTK